MESILKLLLAEQIEERKIKLRDIHREIDKICESDKSQQWISLSTLSRRMDKPENISEDEFGLIRQAVSNVLSKLEWTKAKRTMTERLQYSILLEQAISNGIALHQDLLDYDNTKNDQFSEDALYFYRNAPDCCKKYWDQILETYLLLPDVAKASVLCASYIGRSTQENINRNEKIMAFVDLLPVYDISIANWFDKRQLQLLSNILYAASICDSLSVPEEYHRYAIDSKNIPRIPKGKYIAQNEEEEKFVHAVRCYQNSVTDFEICIYDFIKELSFILFLDKEEWFLAYTSSIFSFHCEKIEDRFQLSREYYETGCTGFRFTERELGYLYTLIHELVT